MSGIGRSRLVSAFSWNLSCWMTWVRKNAPHSTRNAPIRTRRAIVGPLPDAVGIEAVHASSRMENQLRKATSSSKANPAVVSACSGL